MSKPPNPTMTAAVRIIFLVLLALLILYPGVGTLVLIVFVPVMAWVIWRDQDRIAELEKRLAALEKPEPKTEGA